MTSLVEHANQDNLTGKNLSSIVPVAGGHIFRSVTMNLFFVQFVRKLIYKTSYDLLTIIFLEH